MGKISMYKITEELLLEESSDVDSVYVSMANSNNCKAFVNIINDLYIDEKLFKEKDNSYSFNVSSKEAVKKILKHNGEYRQEIKKAPSLRKVDILKELYESIEKILKDNILDEIQLYRELVKLELSTLYKKRAIQSSLEDLMLPNFKYTLSPSDNEVLLAYYLNGMYEVEKKAIAIKQIMSDIRNEEINSKILNELEENPINHMSSKIKIHRLVVKNLLQKNTKKNQNIQDELKNLVEETNLSEKDLKKELKELMASEAGISDNFELATEKEFNNEYESSYDVLTIAEAYYTERLKDTMDSKQEQKEITEHELDEIIRAYKEEKQ